MSNVLFDAIVDGRKAGNGELFIGNADGDIGDQAFLDLSARMAAVLLDRGVDAGDRVAVQVSKSIAALALYVACIRTGAVFLPLNTAYTEAELDYFIGDATPRVLVLDPQKRAMGERLIGASQLLTLDGAGGGSLIDKASACEAVQEIVARGPDDLAAILYTSGTTGRSKGAMLTHANLLSNAQTLVSYWQFTSSDVLLHALPIFHTHGLFVASNVMLLCGGRMIFQPGFSTDAVLQALPSATAMMGVPTFYTRLLADERFTRECASHMRLFISGSAPLLADTHREFEARTGQRILERYGMTETNMNTSNPVDGDRIAGTVGRALPGVEVRVCLPETTEPLPTGEVGILHVRGPNVFAGYWQMPEKTREELLEDGFFITGDLATIDERQYVTIVGRSKDLIISGGYNIYPKELELLIDELPGVTESAVVGVPHPDFGEAVVAVVVRDGSAAAAGLTAENLTAALADRLARFKQPKKVEFVAELPRNTMGKVQKNLLREKLDDAFR
ncbi:malonate--CoA ligase [Granulosicoccus sp. 3-233]|uniref:malonate--CoA ligase n=1 Tax=Granulosicoccus sp. 3-233 TaxID=3417969 RepID=UPI003D34920F